MSVFKASFTSLKHYCLTSSGGLLSAFSDRATIYIKTAVALKSLVLALIK